jgi:hypothetical protein
MAASSLSRPRQAAPPLRLYRLPRTQTPLLFPAPSHRIWSPKCLKRRPSSACLRRASARWHRRQTRKCFCLDLNSPSHTNTTRAVEVVTTAGQGVSGHQANRGKNPCGRVEEDVLHLQVLSMSPEWCLCIFSQTNLCACGRWKGTTMRCGGCPSSTVSFLYGLWPRRPPFVHWIEAIDQKYSVKVTHQFISQTHSSVYFRAQMIEVRYTSAINFKMFALCGLRMGVNGSHISGCLRKGLFVISKLVRMQWYSYWVIVSVLWWKRCLQVSVLHILLHLNKKAYICTATCLINCSW